MKLKEGLMIGLLLLGCPLLLISSRWATRLECKQAVNPKAPNQILVRPTSYKSDVYGLWLLLGLAQGAGAFWLIKEAQKDEGDGERNRAIALPQAPSPIGHLQEAAAPRWQEPERVQAELMPIEVAAQAQPMAQPAKGQPQVPELSKVQPQVPIEFRWFKDLINYPVVLIYGAQGAGKTSFATYLMRQKARSGHALKVLDPHKKYGQWNGLEIVGAGMDYKALDEEMLNFANQVKSEYMKWSEQPVYTPVKSTTLCEEFTNWADHCKRSGLFFKASLSDIRKIGMCVLYISHGRTLATMGGGTGIAKTRDSSLLEVELLTQVDPVSGEASPAFKGFLKYPGKDPVEVAIAPWMLSQNSDFTSVIEPTKVSGLEAVQERFTGQDSRTAEPGTVQDVNRNPDGASSGLENDGSAVQKGEVHGLNLDLSDDSELLNRLTGLKEIGLNQDEIIFAIWGVKKGGTQGYIHARSEYKRLTHEG